jgi:drug/metabolite transporter (DMT)-like permease
LCAKARLSRIRQCRADQLLCQRSGSGSLHLISISGGEDFQSAKLFFVLSGIIQPAIVRVMFYVGIIRLGVSRAGPIRGTSPFFSVAIAFLSFENDRS